MANLTGSTIGASNKGMESLASLPDSEFLRDRELVPVSGSYPVFVYDDGLATAHVVKNRIPSPAAGIESADNHGTAYSNDFYNRLHFLPTNPLDIGNVFADTSSDFQVWNAFVEDVTLDDVTATDADGLTLDGPAVLSTFHALELVDYAINASAAGPPDIDATYLWEVQGIIATLSVLGVRVRVLPFPANWKDPVKESSQFTARYMRSLGDFVTTEQLSKNPRRALNYTALLFQEKSRLADNLLWSGQPYNVLTPVVTDLSTTLAAVAVDDTTVSVNSLDTRNFYEGGSAILLSNDAYEVISIASIAGDVITTSRPVTQDWPAGSDIYPAVIGKLAAQTSLSRHTPAHQNLKVSLKASPKFSDPNLPVVAAATTFEGYEVYLVEPDWADNVNHSIGSDVTMLDQGYGPVSPYTFLDHATHSLQYTWGLTSRQRIQDFRAFLRRREGVANPVFIPTWANDLIATEDIAGGFNGVTVSNDSAFLEIVAGKTSRNSLLIVTHGLGSFPVRISGTTDNGDGTVLLSVTENFASDIPLSAIKQICYMPLCLMVNRVEFTWVTPEVCYAEASFLPTDD